MAYTLDAHPFCEILTTERFAYFMGVAIVGIMSLADADKENFRKALARHGLRATKQREVILEVLMEKRDHPTADVVLERARRYIPSISMATVYNCLETLKECGLIRQVNLKRQATRYCPDFDGSHLHAHFYCTRTGRVHDIELDARARESLQALLPEGFNVDEIELSFRGRTFGNAA